MRILFVINGLGTGGAERSLAEMLPRFREAGIDPIVAGLARRSEGVQESIQEAGVDVRFMSARLVPRLRDLLRLMRDVRPALVHTTIFDADIAGRLASAGRYPVLTSLVNTSYDPIRFSDPAVTRWKLIAAKPLDGWTARHLTTHFHAITGAVKLAAVRDLRIHPDRVTVIERGRDPARLGRPSADRKERARRTLGVLDGTVLVTAGRQEFQKGQWHLLEAMPAIVRTDPKATLVLAGRSGNASGRLSRALRANALNGHVRLLGHRDDLPDVLAAADLFVFPSLYEGLGGTLIEAMALGLPIVASDLPAVREVVESERNAVLVQPGSPPALADAINALAGDPSRREAMGRRSRQIFEERFTLEWSASRMLELFERVAAEGRRAA